MCCSSCQVFRALHERDRYLLFRGWSRLWLHARSFNASVRALATATARTGDVQAQAKKREKKLEVGEASSPQEGAATTFTLNAVEEVKGRGYREAPDIHSAVADHYQKPVKPEQELRRHQERRAAKMVRG